MRRDRHPHDDLRRHIHEPRHPRTHARPVQLHPNRDPLVITLPARVAKRRRTLAIHVKPPPEPLTTPQPGPLPRRQIPDDRALHRRQRRHHRGPTLPFSLGDQFPVHRGDVPTPKSHQLTHVVSHGETVTRQAAGPARRPRRPQPPPHRPLRDPQSRADQPDVPRGQLTPRIQQPQTLHRLRPREHPRQLQPRQRPHLRPPNSPGARFSCTPDTTRASPMTTPAPHPWQNEPRKPHRSGFTAVYEGARRYAGPLRLHTPRQTVSAKTANLSPHKPQ